MRAGHVLLLLAHTGCAPCVGLEDVPVYSDVPDATDKWQETVRLFSSWVDTRSICLTAVRVVPEGERVSPTHDAEGSYVQSARRISFTERSLSHPLDPASTQLHELCHALDFQNVHQRLYLPRFLKDEDYGTSLPAVQRLEMFAFLCSYGPENLERWARIAPGCGYDDLATSAQAILDEVFLPHDPILTEDAWTPEWIGEHTYGPVPFEHAASRGAQHASLYYFGEESSSLDEIIAVNLRTGEVVDRRDVPSTGGLFQWYYNANDGPAWVYSGQYVHPAFGRVFGAFDDPPGTPPFHTLYIEEPAAPGTYKPVDGICSTGFVDATGSEQGVWFYGGTPDGVEWWHLPGPPVDPALLDKPAEE